MFGDSARAFGANLLLLVEDLAFRLTRRSLQRLRPFRSSVHDLRRIAAPAPSPSRAGAKVGELAQAPTFTWFVPGDTTHAVN